MHQEAHLKNRYQQPANLFLGPWVGSLEKCTISAKSAKSEIPSSLMGEEGAIYIQKFLCVMSLHLRRKNLFIAEQEMNPP